MDPSEEHVTKHKGGDKAHIVARSAFRMQRVANAAKLPPAPPPAAVTRGCIAHHRDALEAQALAAFVDEGDGRAQHERTVTRRVGTRHKRHHAQQRQHRRLQVHEHLAAAEAARRTTTAADVSAVSTLSSSSARPSAPSAGGTTPESPGSKVAEEDIPLNDVRLFQV